EQRQHAAREAEERVALERELRHRDRLAMVGRLAAGVAHEMGAPLNVIDARAEQLQLRADVTPDMRRRNSTIIRAQAERITQIVHQLLNLARPYNLHCKPVDLTSLLNETIEAMEAETLRMGVNIELAADSQIVVNADSKFINQVFL